MKNGFLKKLGLGLALGASVGMIGTGASVLAARRSPDSARISSGDSRIISLRTKKQRKLLKTRKRNPPRRSRSAQRILRPGSRRQARGASPSCR